MKDSKKNENERLAGMRRASPATNFREPLTHVNVNYKKTQIKY